MNWSLITLGTWWERLSWLRERRVVRFKGEVKLFVWRRFSFDGWRDAGFDSDGRLSVDGGWKTYDSLTLFKKRCFIELTTPKGTWSASCSVVVSIDFAVIGPWWRRALFEKSDEWWWCGVNDGTRTDMMISNSSEAFLHATNIIWKGEKIFRMIFLRLNERTVRPTTRNRREVERLCRAACDLKPVRVDWTKLWKYVWNNRAVRRSPDRSERQQRCHNARVAPSGPRLEWHCSWHWAERERWKEENWTLFSTSKREKRRSECLSSVELFFRLNLTNRQ